ncbi:MAG: hypothetical protein HDS75_07985 [Bacteroidales bacterium]|nr:hypothetical protein [Bacteroidales bacterium]
MDNNLYATHKGIVKIGEYSVPCAVLNNGKRVFIQREIVGLLTGNKKGGLDRYLQAKTLQEYVPDKFKGDGLVQNVYKFRLDNKDAHGFEATDVIDISMMYINANNDGKLLASQKHLAAQSLVIVSAFAKTGVIAVIDEATGYLKEKNRAKDELQKFLQSFMREEAAKLVKRFEDSFFEMIYKMRGWTWNYTHKHPGVVGQWINDLVYERIAPMVLSELRKKNPTLANGQRKYKHHQFLTDEIGIPKLLAHISTLEAFGRASNYDWNMFLDMVDRAFPKQNQQLRIFFGDIYLEDKKEVESTEKTSSFNKLLTQALNYDPKKDKRNDNEGKEEEDDEDFCCVIK